MFKTIGNTLDLIGGSWRVLQEDRRIILFPIMSGLAVLAVAAVFLGIFAGTGTYDRLTDRESVQGIDVVLGLGFYFIVTFTVIFFNSALIAVAHDRLRGGSPSLRYGLRVSSRHLGSIIGWSLIAGTVGLLLNMLREDDSLVARIIGWILSSIWAFTTFLVIPVLVVEGIGPWQALRRSTELFTKTWGKQAVANFGFGLAYIAVVIVAAMPIMVGAAIAPEMAFLLGVLVSLPALVIGIAGLLAMDGIFRAALYQYAAAGAEQSYFPSSVLRKAYVASKDDRGDWGSGGSLDDHSLAMQREREQYSSDYYRSGGTGLMR